MSYEQAGFGEDFDWSKSCPSGWHWDGTFCVPDGQTAGQVMATPCPAGTIKDPILGICISTQIPSVPTTGAGGQASIPVIPGSQPAGTVTCPSGSVRDPILGMCVPLPAGLLSSLPGMVSEIPGSIPALPLPVGNGACPSGQYQTWSGGCAPLPVGAGAAAGAASGVAVAGVGIGALVVLGLLGTGAYLLLRKKK